MLPKNRKNVSRLSVFRIKSKRKVIRNKFYSKAHCYKANFSQVHFKNVNFKGSILTNCNFKQASFSQIEFLGSNLKRSNFTGATFEYCIFSAALLKKANFQKATFKKCIFVNTNLDVAKKLSITDDCRILKEYPKVTLDEELIYLLDGFRFNPKIHNSRVLHLKGGKLNHLTLMLLLERFGLERLKKGLLNLGGELTCRVVNFYSLFCVIDKATRYG
jgi:hypothetical protein